MPTDSSKKFPVLSNGLRITNKAIEWSEEVLEKLIYNKPLKKFSSFCGTQRSVTLLQ
jgi:hypothetical protein